MARGKKENVIEMNRQDEKDIRTYTFEDALDVTENNMKPDGYDIKSSQKSLEVNDGKDYIVQTIKGQEGEKVYTYDEAIDLAGVGMYIYVMVAVLACALEAMALDMFGLSIVVSSACDLNLSQSQKSILLSMPFIGSVLMSYPWGYIADTQGRLKGLRFALWGSFILGSISAFSPNSIVLGILRFSSTSLSSGIHSLSLTLLGESCSSKIKGAALIGVTTLLIFTFGIYSALGYLVLSLEFSVDIGFVVFTPWRLLTLVLAFPLGILALCTLYFVESPKFLLNAEDEKIALILLRKIGARNGVKVNEYPVKRVVLNESTPLRKDVPLLQSLKDQIVPIFKPPLVYRAIQLFFITGVIYATNNGFYSWLPFVADTLTGKIASDSNVTNGNLCELISNYKVSNNTSTCIATVSEFTMWMGLVQGAAFSFLNLGISMLSNRKKTVLICMLLTSFLCAVAIPFAPGTILNLSLFFGYLITSLCSAISFSYFVDLFPTSHRGMAACLGVMTARISALAGVNLVGYYLVSNCANSLFTAGAVVMSGVIASAFLPADKLKIK